MEQFISTEKFQELMDLEGETRGVGFKTEAQFIEEKQGKEAREKFEKAMADLGLPYSDIKALNFYPLGWLGVALVVMSNLFGFKEEDFEEMGRFEAKSSLVIKLFMKYFVSLERVKKEAGRMWREYYTVGTLEVPELDQEKKHIMIQVKDFKLHPFLCHVLQGYFVSIVKMIVNSEVESTEQECVHQGDRLHLFLIKWK